MPKTSSDLMKEAKDAIENVFGDTRVSQRETVDRLAELEDDISMKIKAIEADILREEG